MISSRQHAVFDTGLALALAGSALIPALPPRVRLAALIASCVQAGSTALTDYEGGFVPKLSLSTHRSLQAVSGTVLCLTGVNRGGRGGGWVLCLAGIAQIAVAAGAHGPRHGHRHGHPPSMAYAPLDTPKPFAEGVWLVDSLLGPGIPVRMTVVRLPDGTLLLHSPTRFDPRLRAELEAIGPIRHLVAPNSVHWLFMKSWQDQVAGTTSWGAPGLRRRRQVRKAGLVLDRDLGDRPPTEWQGALDCAVLRGGGFAEVALLHRPSRTLLMCDMVQNFERHKLPWVLRPIAALLGNLAPEGRAPAHLRALVRLGGTDPSQARRVADWAPESVVMAHGAPIVVDAAGAVRRSLAWLGA